MSSKQLDVKYVVKRAATRTRALSDLLKFAKEGDTLTEASIFTIGDMIGELADQLEEAFIFLQEEVITDDLDSEKSD